MNIGAIIKLNRIQQNLTQEELAEGIISVSYLSKIENGKIEPNEEIIKLLCTRLDIDIKTDSNEEVQALCQRWFEVVLNSGAYTNLDEYKAEYEKIEKAINSSTDIELKLLVNIHLIRYYLKIGEVLTAKKHVEELKSVYKTFTNLQKYYWNKFSGNYYYATNDFNESIRCYVTAEDLYNKNQSPEEFADLNYCMSLAYLKLRINSLSLHTITKALEVYRNVYQLSRCAECHIVLGIAYRRLNNTELAVENYYLAKKLAEQLNLTEIITLANQNLGHLYSQKGDPEEATKILYDTAYNEDAEINERLLALISIIEIQYKNQQVDNIKTFIEKALEILSKKQHNKVEFVYEVHMFLYLVNQDYASYEKLVINDFIPLLEKQQDFGKLIVITELLADYYQDTNKYKNAAKYYKLVNNYYKKITEI